MTTHVVPSDVFDELAGGGGRLGGALYAGLRSKRLLLLHELVSTVRTRLDRQFIDAGWSHTLTVLTDAQRRARQSVDDVLLQPHVGAWAVHCLRELRTSGRLTPVDLGHMAAIAAAAAVRAGLSCRLLGYAHADTIMFPGLGAARVPLGNRWCRLRIRAGAAGVEVSSHDTAYDIRFAATPSPTWSPLYRLRSVSRGLMVEIQLDDLDPYRGCGHLPVIKLRDEAAVAGWQESLDSAWELLVRDHPGVADAVADGIACLVPMASTPEAPQRSATCFESLGAIVLTPPRTQLSLALALTHELQHTKLAALVDLVPLLATTDDEAFYAPWRPDPRPLPGLLQGTYAWLGLTGFWAARHRAALQSSVREGGAELAPFELAMARQQTACGLDTLGGSGRLTPAGRRFAGGMRRRLVELDQAVVPAQASRLASLICGDHLTSWRFRNVRPDPERVARCVDAWLGGRSCRQRDVGPAMGKVVDGDGPLPSDVRLALLRRRLADRSERWLDDGPLAPSAGDLALVEGDSWRAAAAYSRAISNDPDDMAAWTGLAVATTATTASTPAARALSTRPELVYAVHRAIRSRCGGEPGVHGLAGWIGQALPGA